MQDKHINNRCQKWGTVTQGGKIILIWLEVIEAMNGGTWNFSWI
jgi:hypothetical protein